MIPEGPAAEYDPPGGGIMARFSAFYTPLIATIAVASVGEAHADGRRGAGHVLQSMIAA